MLKCAKNVTFTNPTSVILFRKTNLIPTLRCMNFMKKSPNTSDYPTQCQTRLHHMQCSCPWSQQRYQSVIIERLILTIVVTWTVFLRHMCQITSLYGGVTLCVLHVCVCVRVRVHVCVCVCVCDTYRTCWQVGPCALEDCHMSPHTITNS